MWAVSGRHLFLGDVARNRLGVGRTAESCSPNGEAYAPQAVTNFCTDFDKTLCSLDVDVPRSCVSLMRTTNLLERFHQEVRRKQRDIGMCQSERRCEVL